MSQIIEPAITAAPACKITEFHIKDFWSSMTHFIGFIMSFCGSLFLMQRAFSTEEPIAIASMGIFSLSLMLLYAASTIYHTLDLDARRNQVYTGLYIFEKEDRIRMKSVMEQTAVGFDELAAKLNVLGREVLFLGDGVPVFAEAMKELLRIPYYFAPAHMNRQRAASVAALGKEKFEQGIFEDAADHAPEYLRLSQAERERQEKA